MIVANKKELEDFIDYPLASYFKTLNAGYVENKIGFELTYKGNKIRFDYPFHPFAIMEAILKEKNKEREEQINSLRKERDRINVELSKLLNEKRNKFVN